MDIEQKEQIYLQSDSIIHPYQKLRLKGVKNQGGLAQETTGLLAAVKVSPQRDTSLEDLLAPLLRENDHNQSVESDTQGRPIIHPYQKLRLKGQETTGSMAALRASLQRDTPHPELQLKSVEGSVQETTGRVAALRVSSQRDAPYQKIRLKSVENPAGATPETTGRLLALKASPQKDIPVEELASPPQREHNRKYVPEIDTFEFPEFAVFSMHNRQNVQDGAARWKILVVLVAILVVSLIFIGIFGAYLLRPLFLHYLHLLVS